MKQNKALYPILILLILIGFFSIMYSSKETVKILPESCDHYPDVIGLTITDQTWENEKCLLLKSGQELVHWRWSDDGQIFAYAILNSTVTLGQMSGRHGYFRPPSTYWYVLNEQGQAKRFPIADNRNLSLSPDGTYIIFHQRCSYERCWNQIYNRKSYKEICQYTTFSVWFGSSDCPTLVQDNGEIWDIEREENEGGCTYYEKQEWKPPERCEDIQ